MVDALEHPFLRSWLPLRCAGLDSDLSLIRRKFVLVKVRSLFALWSHKTLGSDKWTHRCRQQEVACHLSVSEFHHCQQLQLADDVKMARVGKEQGRLSVTEGLKLLQQHVSHASRGSHFMFEQSKANKS